MHQRWSIALLLLLTVLPMAAQSDPFVLLIGIQSFRMLHEAKNLDKVTRWGVIKQSNEFTCGPAALATLFSYYLGEPTTEEEMVTLAGSDENGATTLLGLRDACRSKGHEASGYQMTLPQLLRELDNSGMPVLVHFTEPSLHYVLVTGHIGDAYLILADPAVGDITVQQSDFLRRWSTKALVVKSTHIPNPAVMADHRDHIAARIATLEAAGAMMSF